MASSIMQVPVIWVNARSSSQGQNWAVGHGTWSPVTAITTTKNTIENGKPNRKRILVAPQVPSGPVSERCIALRATCPSAAVMVKGIQSEVTENMERANPAGRSGHRAGRGRCGQLSVLHATLTVVLANAGTHTPRPVLKAGRQTPSFFHHKRRWLWVPAFAGTTVRFYISSATTM